ncbi:MAG: NAD(+) synthase [Ruminococcus sp.]|nr:NAD(+) synthase [Ruminococcus sp.]MDE7105103.1 NAD(+) synthase [Ruminococcus sp.]
MRVRNNLKGFDVAKTVDSIIKWIRDYFNENAKPETKAVIGISGGKDSSVASALCVRALGVNRVFGVLMPQGKQSDIEYSRKLVDFLKIDSVELNIKDAYSGIMNELETKLKVTEQARVNTPARIRMTMLYAVASCIGGRVANTCNLSEDWVGYATKFGDGAGDFSILSELTVTEVIGIGDFLGLPYELVHKIPIDGLCGKTDEENLGFTYAELDEYIRGFTDLKNKQELKSKIDRMNKANRHKLEPMPKFMI